MIFSHGMMTVVAYWRVRDYSEQVQPLSDPIKVLKAKKPWP